MFFLVSQDDDEQTDIGCDNPGGVGNSGRCGVLEVLLMILASDSVSFCPVVLCLCSLLLLSVYLSSSDSTIFCVFRLYIICKRHSDEVYSQ